MKRILIALVLALSIFASRVWAVPFGQDYLSGAKFQSEILKTHDFKQGVGLFATTFGDALPLATALANKGIPFLRIQLAWSDTHDFKESQFGDIAKQAKRFCPLAQKTKLYLSGACEHKLNSTLAQRLASLIAAACPPATYVNVPLPQGAVLPQYINEIHGGGKPRSSLSAFSFDGDAAEDADVETLKSRFANSEYFMIWGPRYNGRWATNDPTPRPQRKGYADSNYIKSLLYLTNDKGSTSLPKNTLWKPLSENKGNGDLRAGKPVLILPSKYSQATLTKNGKTIASIKYYGTYQGGGFRYYASEYSYQLAQKCGGVCNLVTNKPIGLVNPAFRDPTFR